MLRKIMVLCLVVLLIAGCSGKNDKKEEKPEEPEEVVTVVEEPEQPEEPAEPEEPEGHDGAVMQSADLEIAFLGLASEDGLSLDNVLNRAVSDLGFDIVSYLREDRVIYGDHSERGDYVYLMIPNEDAEILVGRYDALNDEMGEIWLWEEYASPFIYVESSEGTNPQGIIYITRYDDEGNSETSFLYTGLESVNGVLRTSYHMNIVDLTPYEAFDNLEIYFYGQLFTDTLMYSMGDISNRLMNGEAEAHPMEEMMVSGQMYEIYSIEDPAASGSYVYYLLGYDSLEDQLYCLTTEDFESFESVMAH